MGKIAITYLLIVSGFLLWHGTWFSPDQFFAAALVAALLLGRLLQFVQDWSPPLILFLSYEYLRSLIPKLAIAPHIFPMIKFDQTIFGAIPAVTLQHWFFTGSIRWYDYLAAVLYESHFIVFLLVGFLFWLKNKEAFRKYYAALLVLSYMAFITFVIFPAAPPWMASQLGYIPPLADISGKVFSRFPGPLNLPSLYEFFGANQVAAVPSLHAAYPWLTFLFVWARTRILGLLTIPYVLGVWFSVIYLGDHYVFDILIGCLYATVAFLLITRREEVRLWLKTRF
jgi:hypothetical protein